jgi:hypothetical protein
MIAPSFYRNKIEILTPGLNFENQFDKLFIRFTLRFLHSNVFVISKINNIEARLT